METNILQTVERALIILEVLSERNMTATQIQKAMDLNKSTVHRLLATLASRGFIERNNDTGVYKIGLKLVEISSIRLNNIELKTEAAPHLRKLVEKVKQPVHLATYSDGDAVYIEKIENVNSIHMYSQIGKRIPAYCSALGKALLTNFDDKEILEIVNNKGIESFTPTTLKTAEDVVEEIRKAKKEGYAVDNEEHEEGIWCIAAPIYDYRGEVIAALSTAGAKNDFIYDSNSEIINDVKNTAQAISKRLGYIDKN